MDLKDLAIKYLETWALQQQTKEQLIEAVKRLQDRDQELMDLLMKAMKSVGEKTKQVKELEEILSKSRNETEEYKRVADLKLGKAYDVSATWIDKIVFVLKTAGRPLRSSDIISILSKNDSFFRSLADQQKGLSAHLTKALKYGRIIGVKQKGQNGYLFSLPETI